MARERGDILQLLANPTNRAILSVLAVEPQYPRRLADLVGLTEDEASKRLRAFEKLGLAEAEWANLGRTVRLYKLSSASITVHVTPSGLTVRGLGGAQEAVEVGAVAERPPEVPRFVGREAEFEALEALLATRRAACVHGLGGAGKTAFAAAWALRAGPVVAWHTLAPAESGNLLLGRLAANLRALETDGRRAERLLALGADDGQLLVGAIAESADALDAVLVLDRFEGAGEGAGDVAAALARMLAKARLVVTSRTFPKELPRDAVASLRLEGLSRADGERLLAGAGVTLPPETMDAVYARTRGHALSMVLVSLAAGGGRGVSVERLLEDSGVRDFLIEDVLPQLPATEREVLLALSILRSPFSAEEAEAIAATKHARDALLRLEARGLVHRANEAFAIHDLVRSVASDAVPERRRVQARAARALVASGEPMKILEALHHHVEANEAAEAGRLVQEEATSRAYRFVDLGVGAVYKEILERLSGVPTLDASARAAVDLERALLAMLEGEVATAAAHLDDAARSVARRETALASAILLARGRLMHLEGRHDAAIAFYEQVEARAEAEGDERRLLEALVEHGFAAEDLVEEKALAIYLRALAVGERVSDIRMLSLAFAGAARVGERLKDPRFAEWLHEGLRLARLAGYLRGEASMYMTLVTHYTMTGDGLRGIEHGERYLVIARRLGDPWFVTCAQGILALNLTSVGRYAEALDLAKFVVEQATVIESEHYIFSGRIAMAEALIGLGRGEEARPILEAYVGKEIRWPALAHRLERAARAIGLGAPASTRKTRTRKDAK